MYSQVTAVKVYESEIKNSNRIVKFGLLTSSVDASLIATFSNRCVIPYFSLHVSPDWIIHYWFNVENTFGCPTSRSC